jgi:hypothetical protein
MRILIASFLTILEEIQSSYPKMWIGLSAGDKLIYSMKYKDAKARGNPY